MNILRRQRKKRRDIESQAVAELTSNIHTRQCLINCLWLIYCDLKYSGCKSALFAQVFSFSLPWLPVETLQPTLNQTFHWQSFKHSATVVRSKSENEKSWCNLTRQSKTLVQGWICTTVISAWDQWGWLFSQELILLIRWITLYVNDSIVSIISLL